MPNNDDDDDDDEDDDGLRVPLEGEAVRAWLVEQGFEPGDLRSEIDVDDLSYLGSDSESLTPMAMACIKQEVNVCAWLCNVRSTK